MFPMLFSPARIGSLKLKNRLIMPPMVRNYADKQGRVTQQYLDHIESIAKGGTAALILEASFIRPDGKGFLNELGIHSDVMIPGLKKLADVTHKHKAALGIQLYHAGRQTSQKITGTQPVSAAPIPCPIMQEMPRVLTIKEIQDIIQAYAAAARRAKSAGLDFVEIHGAHGYLIQQFLSPYSNKRKDEYGGTPQKRERFLIEVYTAVRQAVGPNFPVIARLSGDELVKGGLTIKDMVKVAKLLAKAGVDALHISSGNYGSYVQGHLIPPMAVPDGVNIPLAKAIKLAVKIPVIAVAKIRTPEFAEKILKSKQADFIAIGRSLLADPEWPKKARTGKTDDIRPCIACNQGCISRLFAQQDVWCTVNPACSRERIFAKKPTSKKSILVIGGGPGGMQAAITAAKRGHKVVLYEASKKLGGQLIAAGAAPYRQGWKELQKALLHDIKKYKVEVKLGARFDTEAYKKSHRKPFDLAVLAAGSTPLKPAIPGIMGANVVMARDLMEGRATAHGSIVVAGGGCMGAQTAEYLSSRGHKVTIVEMSGEIALEAPIDDRYLLLQRLTKRGVKFLTNTSIQKITPKGLEIKNDKGVKQLSADTVVACFGSVSNNSLVPHLKSIAKQVKVIGDAVKARRVTEAVIEGALAVL